MALRSMRWWRPRRRGPVPQQSGDSDDVRHLTDFIASREGVEGFVEPRTTVTETTIVLVAADGEWTRRHVPSAKWAQDFARKQDIACYDAARMGYPPRMREWNRRRSRERRNLDVPDDISGL